MADYTLYTKDKTDELLSTKQAKLTAGANVQISGNTISATDTKYAVASQTADGLMAKADKKKLDTLNTVYAPIAKGVTITSDTNAGTITFTQ